MANNIRHQLILGSTKTYKRKDNITPHITLIEQNPEWSNGGRKQLKGVKGSTFM